ncbi:MAG: FAD-linked oxidase [Thermobacillus sp. ZCTH02-B1]|uniref:FAD-binding oxidoreductase n=1 Tax=Thermobacillus sp. ZCTH02-B1 TaxID=1858795 RepID=UPI000B5815ED|nr:FAD-binding oxidoreductase [Thermobacillus sp. ZCTH02-B1]OUM93776.1 MAG: FAD-linked oxidase [Thermobacillus sp. ZCTH02-B1]
MAMAVRWKPEIVGELIGLVGEEQVRLDPDSREKLSRDYYWYSPVLIDLLKHKQADAIVIPTREDEIPSILAAACRHRIPVTVRGGGTGNYGQAVPLFGGIVLDLSRLTDIVEVGDGYATVQCGARLKALELELRKRNRELCVYPSTYAIATVGGFVCGGSGGIGSITWGNLWDGNVLGAVIYTMEESPRRLEVAGDELRNYIHNYGTTGVMTRVTIRVAPKTDWFQAALQFPDPESAMRFGEKLARDESIRKRLVSISEHPIPTWFIPIAKRFAPGAAVALLEIEEGALEAVAATGAEFGGSVAHTIPADRYQKTLGLSDFSWNHTTLWALKSDPTITYLQAAFHETDYLEQMRRIKERFPDEVLFHFEWVRNGGVIAPSSLPIVRYRNKERLYEIIRFFESVGVRIFDPHTFVLDVGARADYAGMVRRKQMNDPFGLLNPGKIRMPG